MKPTLPALLVLAASAAQTFSAVISQWTFEVNTPPDVTDSATQTSVTADIGSGTARGEHLSALTDWTTPAGNGSAESWSSNNWAIGDYYQFQSSTVGFENITLSWDQTRSSTGPATFMLRYGTDGTTWTDAGQYTVGTLTWSSGTPQAGSAIPPFDLSSVAALENQTSVYFQLQAVSAATGTAGTSRVDNFTVNGERLASVPEGFSGIAGLAGALGLMAVIRYRWAR